MPINLRFLQSRAPYFVADVIGALLTQPRVHRFHTIGQDRLYGPHGSVRSVETAVNRIYTMRRSRKIVCITHDNHWSWV